MALTVGLETRDAGVVIELAGELDLATAPLVEEALADVETTRPQLLVLDLSGLTFMDSTGLRIVLAADAAARREARRLAVVRGPDPVHRVFLMAWLDRRLEIVGDREAAFDGTPAGS
jgi:anti-sigma B factor antagonist